MARLIESLPRHVVADDARSIVHGDLQLDHLVVHAVESRVVAVLDRKRSTLGMQARGRRGPA